MMNRTDRTTDGQFCIIFVNNNKQYDRNATFNVSFYRFDLFSIYSNKKKIKSIFLKYFLNEIKFFKSKN